MDEFLAPRDVHAWLHAHRPDVSCDPWDRWVLIALCRHRPRQAMVEQVVRERLSGSIGDLAVGGAFGHPSNRPGSGEVPGMPAWQYRFHGCGCCLRNVDGTTIDVDFDEHGSESIDPWFFKRYLESAPDLGVVERRIDASGAGMASIQPLLDAGLLEGTHRVRVTSAVMPWCEAASQLLDEHEFARTPERAWLACVLGDYPWAESLLGSETPPAIAEAAAGQQEARCRSLADRITARVGVSVDACVRALAQLSHERALASALVQLDVGRIDVVMTRCVELILEANRPSDHGALSRLLERMHGTEAPKPYLRHLISNQ